jgi:phospholipid-binding lipoprotein MlaA
MDKTKKTYNLSFAIIAALFFYSKSVANEHHDFDINDRIYKKYNQIEVYDPYERFNRSMLKLNKVVDKFIIKPPTQIYNTIVFAPIKRRISSFIGNLHDPLNSMYGMAQLKPKVAFDSFFRFFINSTFGILGLFDVASKMGLKKIELSFGDVLGHYGVKEGAYLILPILGPSTVRNGVGALVDLCAAPINMVHFKDDSKFKNYYYGLRIIVARDKMLGIDKTISDISLDEYIALRSFYYQKIAHQSFQENN